MRRMCLPLALLATALTFEPAPGQEEATVLADTRYPSVEAARAKWTAKVESSPPVEMAGAGADAALKLPCNFSTNRNWRVAWDFQGQWDLSDCRRIVLGVCAVGGPARMILHLRSSAGWYGCNFDAPEGWNDLPLLRINFKAEGRPAGWHNVSAIRLSVVRGEAADSAVLVSGIRAVGGKSLVAVYLNEAGVAVEDGIGTYMHIAANSLERLGIGYELANDNAVAAGRLAGKKVAILPLNPVLPPAAAEEIARFVDRGGKLIVAYCLPAPLDKLLGVRLAGSIEGRDGRLDSIRFRGRKEITVLQRSWLARKIAAGEGTEVRGQWLDAEGRPVAPAVTRNANGYYVGHVLTRYDPAEKDRMLLEMLGDLVPELWHTACRQRLARLGRVAGLGGVDELTAAIASNLTGRASTAVEALLADARDDATGASSLLAEGKAPEATELAWSAYDAYLRAYAMSVPSRPGEFRAAWCHNAAGVAGQSWDRTMAVLAESGFNAVLPNMLWGGCASYPSEHLPPDPRAGGRDLLAECLAASKKHGVAVHVWKVNWNLGGRAPKAFRDELLRAGRLQQDFTGKTLDWLCPSQPVNQKLELDSLLEVVRKYDVAGIHFDYIRYPGDQSCFCPRCRESFEAHLKRKVADWPADVRTGELADAYRRFRRDNITRLVAAVGEQARRIRPGVLISAAVFSHWPSARDRIGQDWKLWVDRGYLDFVCPMQYTVSAPAFDSETRSSLAWAGGRSPVFPGIGATLGQEPDRTLQQILIARKHNTGGFVLFQLGPVLVDEHLPLLRLGATAEPTAWKPTPASHQEP